jgi:hypothetical protein
MKRLPFRRAFVKGRVDRPRPPVPVPAYFAPSLGRRCTNRIVANIHKASIDLPYWPLRQAAKAAWLSVLVVVNRVGSQSRVRAFSRYWWWQIARHRNQTSTLELQLRPSGGTFHLPPWSAIGGMLVAIGSHEPDETAFMTRVVREGDTFVDVGANIGL